MEASTELLVALVGAITAIIMSVIGKISMGIDKAPKILRAFIVLALAAPIAWLSGYFGMKLPADPLTWDGATINALLTWLSAMGLHAVGKKLKSGG
jgi:hypothetical protein